MTVRVPAGSGTLHSEVVLNRRRPVHGQEHGRSMVTMKKFLMLAALGTLIAVAVKKVRSI